MKKTEKKMDICVFANLLYGIANPLSVDNINENTISFNVLNNDIMLEVTEDTDTEVYLNKMIDFFNQTLNSNYEYTLCDIMDAVAYHERQLPLAFLPNKRLYCVIY